MVNCVDYTAKNLLVEFYKAAFRQKGFCYFKGTKPFKESIYKAFTQSEWIEIKGVDFGVSLPRFKKDLNTYYSVNLTNILNSLWHYVLTCKRGK